MPSTNIPKKFRLDKADLEKAIKQELSSAKGRMAEPNKAEEKILFNNWPIRTHEENLECAVIYSIKETVKALVGIQKAEVTYEMNGPGFKVLLFDYLAHKHSLNKERYGLANFEQSLNDGSPVLTFDLVGKG